MGELILILKEVQALRRWKAEMMQLEAEWDEQEVARLLGIPLGKPIRPQIVPRMRELFAL